MVPSPHYLLRRSRRFPPRPRRLKCGGQLTSARVITRVDPEYPKLARQAGASGVVELEATISADGKVKNPRVVKGNSMLQKAGHRRRAAMALPARHAEWQAGGIAGGNQAELRHAAVSTTGFRPGSRSIGQDRLLTRAAQ